MPGITRRQFLESGARATLALGASQFIGGCRSVDPPYTPTAKPARVAAVRGANLYKMTREALAAFGGAEAIVSPGDTVFIKPNLCTAGFLTVDGVATGSCTKPDIVIALAEEFLRVGAEQVVIGDGGQARHFSWKELHTVDGSTNLSEESRRLNAAYPGKLQLACLMADSPGWDAVPSPYTDLGRILVSSLVSRADKVISVPVLKTHMITQMTASLKNLVGATSTEDYGFGTPSRMTLHNAMGGIEQCLLDICSAIQPDFAIIDGSICGEGNGPTIIPGVMGATVDMRDRLGDWLLLASDDLAAADATAARVINHDVDRVRHLRMAYDQGLGQTREDLIEIVGAGLDELRVEWQPATPMQLASHVVMQGLGLILDR
ncbi:MAG: DUF362 domain-containing protein [Phycisphaerae bacterium]|nr:DUF362 domain-containing protein [Phycisphaerae bacterium]